VKTNSLEIADFFHQLALLTGAGLPLPETLRQLAAGAGRAGTRTMIAECADAVGKGQSLASSLEAYGDRIPPFYRRMIAAGEQEGALPEILSELAKIARLRQLLASLVKDIILYPFITVSLALLILLFFAVVVVPEFNQVFSELLEGAPMPGLTAFFLWFFLGIRDHIIFFGGLYGVYLIGMIAFFCNQQHSQRLVLWLVSRFPFADMIFYNHAMARLCTMWAAMIRRRVPAETAFPALAEIMDFPALAAALNRLAEAVRNGQLFADALERELNISRLLVVTVKNTPEGELPNQLDRLSELFLERASYGFRRAGMVWELISMIGMLVIIGTIILILFAPLLTRLLLH